LLVDVHAHLYDKNLIDRIDEIILEAEKNKVEKIICVSDNPTSAEKVLDISKKYKNIYACIGVHPSEAHLYNNSFASFLEKHGLDKKVVAIGEIGLDYHFQPYDKESQIYVFLEQLKIAYSLKLPIQIHCRDAMKDMLTLLNDNKDLLKYGGILHCFSGTLNDLEEIKRLGLKISVGGVITFKNAKTFQELIKQIPIEQLMFETDCPYLTPHPFRGNINEPKYLALTAEKVADLKEMNFSEVARITTENSFKLFNKLK